MKRFLVGVLVGLLTGWVFVPSGHTDDGDNLRYKQYLSKMLASMKEVNEHLAAIELNTRAVKDKLHA